MQEFGHFALALAWLLALFGMIAGIYAGYVKSSSWFLTVRNATMLVGGSTGVALFALGYSFYHDDYTNKYVWQFSNIDMPWQYKVSAIWGGMDGSMLLWCFMLAASCGVVAWRSTTYRTSMMPYVLGVCNSTTLFFLTITFYLTNPFRYLDSHIIPNDGNGLNPLLQNPYMAIHPPTLYAGFTLFAIPYAFCMGALLSGQISNEWIRLTRRWTLIAWAFLTTGIVLGGHWAYLELGWGGFWAWDPVENASFLPWLTGTAFVHSVMVQERKNMLRIWNVWLIVATFALTVFGTFLTRSGVVQSVHAFAATDIGWVFLLYIGIILGGALAATLYRKSALISERGITSFLSREAFFLVNNLVLLSICFAVMWGTLFPVLSEAVTGTKQTVGIPFFNAVTLPLFLLMIALMGVGPLIAWQKASIASLIRTFSTPMITAIIVAGIVVWAGVSSFYATLSYALCWFAFMTILGEVHRTIRVQRQSSQDSLGKSAVTSLKRHHVRYGGYLVHFGVVVATVAITASMTHKVERDIVLTPGGAAVTVGRFSLTLNDLKDGGNDNYTALIGQVTINATKDGALLGTLYPEMRRYSRNNESTSEVAILSSARDDLYLVLAGLDETGERATVKVFINPLQMWLWIGTIIMVIGTVIALIPRKKSTAAPQEGVQA
jgi:cytochrome c-type biogenesis protein CcmF